jgi:hypothetical protein
VRDLPPDRLRQSERQFVRIRHDDSVKCRGSPGAMMPIMGRNRSWASRPARALATAARAPEPTDGALRAEPRQRPPQPQHRLGRDGPPLKSLNDQRVVRTWTSRARFLSPAAPK